MTEQAVAGERSNSLSAVYKSYKSLYGTCPWPFRTILGFPIEIAQKWALRRPVCWTRPLSLWKVGRQLKVILRVCSGRPCLMCTLSLTRVPVGPGVWSGAKGCDLNVFWSCHTDHEGIVSGSPIGGWHFAQPARCHTKTLNACYHVALRWLSTCKMPW